MEVHRVHVAPRDPGALLSADGRSPAAPRGMGGHRALAQRQGARVSRAARSGSAGAPRSGNRAHHGEGHRIRRAVESRRGSASGRDAPARRRGEHHPREAPVDARATHSESGSVKAVTIERQVARAGWLFLAPALILIGLFFFLPAAAALVLSITDFDIYALADIDNEIGRASCRERERAIG